MFLPMVAKRYPSAVARIHGNEENPRLNGKAEFYETPYGGVLVTVEVDGLPESPAESEKGAGSENGASSGNAADSYGFGFHGMHIHEYGNCTPPFAETGSHYNPAGKEHPGHAGDMPPLLANKGYAWMSFYDNRFTIEEILGKSIVIHSMRDDFTTQPAGDSGEKIGCGVIEAEASIQN